MRQGDGAYFNTCPTSEGEPMHAITRNLPTCSAPKCNQPATVLVLKCRPAEGIKLAVDGRTYWHEHEPVAIDYCEHHGSPE